MSSALTSTLRPSWQHLYEAAVLELDARVARVKVAAAYEAIETRIVQISLEQVSDEKHQIEYSLHILDSLRRMYSASATSPAKRQQ